jgi:hypothetical protein
MPDWPAALGSRRDVLRLAAGGAAVTLLASCGLDGGDAPAEAGDAYEAVPAELTMATPEPRAAVASSAPEASSDDDPAAARATARRPRRDRAHASATEPATPIAATPWPHSTAFSRAVSRATSIPTGVEYTN